MNPKRFFTGLGITSLLQLIINLGLAQFIPAWKPHQGFILVCMLIMILFCIFIYSAARIVVRSTMTRLYIQLIMLAVFFKLIVCLGLIIIYKKAFEPADNAFIWSFLLIYISYTVYEVIFLDKVGRQKNKPAA